MSENVPFRNTEHYADPTAYNAVNTVLRENADRKEPAAGEIWRNNRGIEALILNNQGWFCNALVLVDDDRKPCKVHSVAMKYTDPAQLSYIKNFELCEFVKSIPETDLAEIRVQVCAALGLYGESEENNALKACVKSLQIERDEMKRELDALVEKLAGAAQTIRNNDRLTVRKALSMIVGPVLLRKGLNQITGNSNALLSFISGQIAETTVWSIEHGERFMIVELQQEAES